MQGDGSGESPDARRGDGDGTEWTVEDFDNFAAFDEDLGLEDDTSEAPDDEPAQSSLDFDAVGATPPGEDTETEADVVDLRPIEDEDDGELFATPDDEGELFATPDDDGEDRFATPDDDPDGGTPDDDGELFAMPDDGEELFATPDDDGKDVFAGPDDDVEDTAASPDEPTGAPFAVVEAEELAPEAADSSDEEPEAESPDDPSEDDSPVFLTALDGGDEPEAAEEPSPDEPEAQEAEDPDAEDTMEAVFEGGAAASMSDDDEDIGVPDFASFSSEEYVQTTTQEFVDLAEEMARASEEVHEQSAISAEIPGLESGIVGLDDVVAATGDDPTTIPVAPRSNFGVRVFTGLALAIIFFASLVEPLFVGLFMLVALVLAAGEFYSAFMRAGHRPLGLFGILGTIGALAGTWVAGLIAVPVAAIATLTATLVFFGLTGQRRDPTTGAALTVLGMMWIGGMGAFMFELVQADDYGWLIVATIVTVAVMDMFSYFVGRRVGRHRLAPRVSPKKTVEGLVGGMLAALLVGVAFGLREPFDLASGLALGAVVAVISPLGDLAVSVLKRAIGVKDMGTLLPGHGGVLDRIDAMLFVMPMAWIVFRWTGLLA